MSHFDKWNVQRSLLCCDVHIDVVCVQVEVARNDATRERVSQLWRTRCVTVADTRIVLEHVPHRRSASTLVVLVQR